MAIRVLKTDLILAGLAGLISAATLPSEYPGHAWVFCIFSALTILFLMRHFRQDQGYSIFYLSLFLFLGFWWKSINYFWKFADLTEPVGAFNFTVSAWNEVFYVGIAGLMGCLCGSVIYKWVNTRTSNFSRFKWAPVTDPPHVYLKNRVLWRVSAFLFALVLAYMNYKMGIHQVGLTPRTVLPWPGNAVISMILNYGLYIPLMFFVLWDQKVGNGIVWSLSLLLATSWIFSVSLLSRSVFVFVTGSVLLVLCRKLKMNSFSRRRIALIAAGGFLTLVMAIVTVELLRGQRYLSIARGVSERQQMLIRLEVLDGGIEEARKKVEKNLVTDEQIQALLRERTEIVRRLDAGLENSAENKKVSQLGAPEQGSWHSSLTVIWRLFSSRFVGLEGVMVVQSLPEKGRHLFLSIAAERKSLKVPDAYQKLAKSSYQYTDRQSYQFFSTPGLFGFLYMSGSFVVVFLGTFCCVLIMGIAELLVRILTGNPFVISFFSIILANVVAQISGAIRSILLFYFIFFLFLIIFLLLIKILKRLERD